MTRTSKSRPVAVTQAKKIPADGSAPQFYYSKPKVRLLDIKGRLWLWRQMRGYRRTERAALREWRGG